MSRFFIPLILFTAGCLICLGGWFGRNVPVAEQWPMFEALRATAAIIFAVIGAWMAIIFPERLKLSFRPGTEKSLKTASEVAGFGQLFTPVVHSTMILGVVLLLGILYPILRHVDLPINLEMRRGISYALLVTLTFWQMWTVLLTLVPADKVKYALDSSDARHKTFIGVTELGMHYEKGKPDRDVGERRSPD